MTCPQLLNNKELSMTAIQGIVSNGLMTIGKRCERPCEGGKVV